MIALTLPLWTVPAAVVVLCFLPDVLHGLGHVFRWRR